jgi:hypothetical protein
MTNRSDFNQKRHETELKTLLELLQRIRHNLIWITSVRIDKTSVGSGYRLTMYFMDRE